MWVYQHTDNLQHHGIVGMKWGVRRYQNKDGSLTNSGKKRYQSQNTIDAKKDLDNAKSNLAKVKKSTAFKVIKSQGDYQKLINASTKVTYATQDLKDSKILDRLESKGEKSQRQLSLEDKYKSQGMHADEAAVAAYKRIRTEKILAVSAGVTVAAATAYVATKHYKQNVDSFIKVGDDLQNLSTNGNKGVEDAFYASRKSSDNKKYIGLFGTHLNAQSNEVYKTQLNAVNNIKIASPKNAKATLSELMTDSEFSGIVKQQVQGFAYQTPASSKQGKMLYKALDDLKRGKITDKVYDAVNITLVDHSPYGNFVSSKLYDALKSKGYGAIQDMNDSKYSGYNAKSAVIVFDGAKNLARTAVSSVPDKVIRDTYSTVQDARTAKALLKVGAQYAAAAVTSYKTVTGVNNLATRQKVKQYIKDHPNTKMSYKEIARSLG